MLFMLPKPKHWWMNVAPILEGHNTNTTPGSSLLSQELEVGCCSLILLATVEKQVV